MDLSIVIVSHNTASFLDGCLRSLQEHAPSSASFEVAVVDNASRDGTPEMVRAKYPTVTLVENRENSGFPAANNRGLRETSGRYVLFLNPDTEMRAGTLDRMLDFMDDRPRAGAATCFVQLPSGTLDDAAHRDFPTPWNAFCHFSGLSRLFPRSRLLSGYSMGWADLSHVHEIEALAGAFMLVRRPAGEAVGWWDEDYFFYGDDLDFCWRLRCAGWGIYFVPDVSILHYKGAASGIRKESRQLTTADRATKALATRYRFQAMRTFYEKHLVRRYPRPVTWLVSRGVDALEAWSRRRL